MALGLPSGTVTFLLTDIEGSTRLLRRLGEGYTALLDAHRGALRSAFAAHRGVEFKSEGDALLAAFSSAADALSAAVDGQARLRTEPSLRTAGLVVRMGLHTGIAYPRDGDYIALALHQAARVAGTGNGGQVVASAEAVAAAGNVDGIATHRLGAFRLRDFEAPAELHQITGTGAPDERFAALRAVPADGHNLSTPRDSFVGRAEELAELGELVGRGRLVTVVGPGGMGKTRLTVEFALRSAASWPDGVWMADLVAVPAGQPIGPVVAEALGATPGDRDPIDAVVEHLRDQDALLILDNCEHVLAAARELADAVLSGCPSTGVLASSRERLGVRGEQALMLLPLPLTGECLDLFRDRTHERDAVGHLVEVDDDDVLLEICRRLDGMPLAIELAAARASVLAPREILDGLDGRLASLRRRDGAATERQQTLRGLINWSYDLLEETERAVFRRLSVFVGSFDLGTATAATAHDDVDPDEVAETVWSLADKSLVNVERREGSTRYRMLQTIRAVAAEIADAADEAHRTRIALAEQYLTDFPLAASGRRSWRARLTLEHPTVSELASRLLEDGDVELAHAMVRLGVEPELGADSYRDALRVLRAVVDGPTQSSPGAGRLHVLVCRLLGDQGDTGGAQRYLEGGMRLLQEYGDVDRLGPVLLSGARIQLCLRDGSDSALDEADAALRADLERRLPHVLRAELLVQLALVAQARGEPSRLPLEEAETIADEADDHVLRTIILNNLAEDELRSGETGSAAGHQREALRLSAELGMAAFTGFALILAARIAYPAGHEAIAVRLHGAADVLLEECGVVLLPDDRALSDQLLATARARLGDAYEGEVAVGRALPRADALAVAEEVFAEAVGAG